MMDLDTIEALSREAAAQAAERNLTPYVPYNVEEIDRYRSFPFPMLGNLVPDGWELTGDEWFVDSSGFGREGELALTAEQFTEELKEYVAEHPGYGFAVTQAGQFQVYVSAFKSLAKGNWRIGLSEVA
jgi:hypothetical protein